VRLTYNWSRGWTGLDHEDWRYTDFHERFPKLYWGISFFGLHMLPTLQVFLGCIPLYYAVAASSRPLGWIDALAVVVTSTGIFFETVGDRQLHDFVNGPKKPGETLNTGLWRYTRHPNYFGGVSFWWGMALFGFAAAPDAWLWCFAGAVAMTMLFVFVSLPLMEKRSLERRPGYAEVIERTSILIPWFPKK
jgi:steroid 5-alpha reductase family enzyme